MGFFSTFTRSSLSGTRSPGRSDFARSSGVACRPGSLDDQLLAGDGHIDRLILGHYFLAQSDFAALYSFFVGAEQFASKLQAVVLVGSMGSRAVILVSCCSGFFLAEESALAKVSIVAFQDRWLLLRSGLL